MLKAAEDGKTSRFVLRSIWMCHYRRILAALCLQLFYSGIQARGACCRCRSICCAV